MSTISRNKDEYQTMKHLYRTEFRESYTWILMMKNKLVEELSKRITTDKERYETVLDVKTIL